MFSNLPFDLRTTFDTQHRQQAVSPLQVKGALLYVRARLAHAHLSFAGHLQLQEQEALLYQLDGQYAAAIQSFTHILHELEHATEKLPPGGRQAKIVANRIRLAHTHMLKEDYAAASKLYNAMLAEMPRWSEALREKYAHFLWQHAGKNELAQQHVTAARRLLNKALDARIALGDAELIASTRRALASCEETPCK